MLPLNADDRARNAANDRCCVTGAGADLEYNVGRRNLRGFDHQGDNVRLGDGLPGLDR